MKRINKKYDVRMSNPQDTEGTLQSQMTDEQLSTQLPHLAKLIVDLPVGTTVTVVSEHPNGEPYRIEVTSSEVPNDIDARITEATREAKQAFWISLGNSFPESDSANALLEGEAFDTFSSAARDVAREWVRLSTDLLNQN